MIDGTPFSCAAIAAHGIDAATAPDMIVTHAHFDHVGTLDDYKDCLRNAYQCRIGDLLRIAAPIAIERLVGPAAATKASGVAFTVLGLGGVIGVVAAQRGVGPGARRRARGPRKTIEYAS